MCSFWNISKAISDLGPVSQKILDMPECKQYTVFILYLYIINLTKSLNQSKKEKARKPTLKTYTVHK